MFSKTILAVLSLSLALSIHAAPAAAHCPAVSVMTVTVTATAPAGTQSNSGAGGDGNNTKKGTGSGKGSGGKNGGGMGNGGGKGKGSGKGNGADEQSSLTLDPSVIAKGFAQNGQATPEAGQVASLTSTNNFINFCATTKQPITNGKQIATGSCNPAPMGIIPSVDNMPSAKFTYPKNFGTIQANKPFNISMAIKNMEAGFFVNAEANYFAAPQFTNAKGQIQGHSHVVVEQLTSLTQTEPTDPKKFAFFKGLNAPAQNGILTAAVTAGLPAGVYKLSSINSAANHQPVLVPIAQHGSLDDAVYFTVTDNGAHSSNKKPAPAAASSTAKGKGNGAAASPKGSMWK
jgi:hypothetical protein